jgi:hypothetical protein
MGGNLANGPKTPPPPRTLDSTTNLTGVWKKGVCWDVSPLQSVDCQGHDVITLKGPHTEIWSL